MHHHALPRANIVSICHTYQVKKFDLASATIRATAPTIDPSPRFGLRLIADGADAAVEAPRATAVFVSIIDGENEILYRLNQGRFGLWSGHIPGVREGTVYGLRADGPWNPGTGSRYNVAKLLLDPYARGLARRPILDQSLYSHDVDADLHALDGMARNDDDSAHAAALGVVVADTGTTTIRPATDWADTVIYEAHVVGLTKTHPEIPEELRGTYAGVAHPAMIRHLKNLGVTAIELLPIHAKMDEPFLQQRGLENYWGYNTLSYFAPEPTYATAASQAAGAAGVINEVKGMVALLHDAGIEVILDVVYNHSCEGGVDGPTLSWRGLDSHLYYRHDSAHPGRLKDTTGCGNSFDFRRRSVIGMTLDSLRYWVSDIGVDGFRFDLATTLGREGESFNRSHPLYVAMATDPVLSRVKLINEPWDVGYGGWRTGQFMAPTADWNDRFRDTLRSFWLTEPATMADGGHGSDLRDLATRMSGSIDLFGHGTLPGGRGIHASVNFVTAHDGFTLTDLTRYNSKHNEANGESNRDGSDNNRSFNHGVEGPASAAIEAARRKSARNLMASLLLAAGTPMLTAGDEIGKTQEGNNNAYCQNSDLSWLDWELDEHANNMFATTAHLTALRRAHAALRPTSFFTGEVTDGDTIEDLQWCDASGQPMPDEAWFDPSARLVQMLRSGRGEGADVLIVVNGTLDDQQITLPAGRGDAYALCWSSEWESPTAPADPLEPGSVTHIGALSISIYVTAS